MEQDSEKNREISEQDEFNNNNNSFRSSENEEELLRKIAIEA